MFRREWFEIVDDWPRDVSGIVRAWDDAATRGGGDWTVGVLMARARTGIFYVIDVVRIQGSPLDVERLKVQTAKTDAEISARHASILLQQEPGAAGKSFIDAQVRGPLCGYYVQIEKPTGDKYTRALPMSSAAQAGNMPGPSWASVLPKDQSVALFKEAMMLLLQHGLKVEELAEVAGLAGPSTEVTATKLEEDEEEDFSN